MIKAIETEYNGYKFRSRTEARWAVFFDALGIKYEYELEGFNLGNGLYYLPDFRLPDHECWIEIKGPQPTQLEMKKAMGLARTTQEPVYIFWGIPGRLDIEIDYKNNVWNHRDGSIAFMVSVDEKDPGTVVVDPRLYVWSQSIQYQSYEPYPLYIGEVPPEIGYQNIPDDLVTVCHRLADKGAEFHFGITPTHDHRGMISIYLGGGRQYDHPAIIRAYVAARQARFEHGETPTIK